jgi:hypothetical protein
VNATEGRAAMHMALRSPEGAGLRAGEEAASALADWRVFYVKANGTLSAKVFKGSTVQIGAHGHGVLEKTLSLRQMSTRTHHPGRHTVEIVLNGHAHSIGHFDLHP